MISRILYFLLTALCAGLVVAGMILFNIGDVNMGSQCMGIGTAGAIMWFGLSKVLDTYY